MKSCAVLQEWTGVCRNSMQELSLLRVNPELVQGAWRNKALAQGPLSGMISLSPLEDFLPPI